MLAIAPEAPVNFIVSKGASFSYTRTAKDSSGIARDLTGYTGKAEMRKKSGDPVVATFTITIPTPTNGEIVMALSAVDTAALDFGNDEYLYDLLLTSDAWATVELEMAGTVKLMEIVTEVP